MQARKLLPLFILVFISLISCEKGEKNPSLDDFCKVKPMGWDCEIIQDKFNVNDIPKNTASPVAIIKYKNSNSKFARFNDSINPRLTLDFYSINQKNKLVDLIKSQQIYSWCVPIYYGETRDYFILTSPCFINSGIYTDEADSCINDLQKALKSIITIKNYGFIGN